MRIGLMLFPKLTQLDLTGPAEVFFRMPGAEVSLLWKTLDPVRADTGLTILPTATFDQCDTLDLICVPGGPGQIELMEDRVVLDFLRRIAPGCRLVTSVCTGSLVLAAAGLLTGYRATSHWASREQLARFGAIPVAERVVRDRNRITGGGVTSGIDFALTVASELLGPERAQAIQLQMEYDPQPPFTSGSPARADPAVVESVRAAMKPMLDRRLAATEAAAARLEAEQKA
ncbi:DJ-1/PfpI family protein [Rhizobium sp. YIM 134829]|uniref:DJ-1/PfpI family protein n=1 Tax=Rhizobium sp. YIM 134829 TaxID=3390453 RepID=UPI003979B617